MLREHGGTVSGYVLVLEKPQIKDMLLEDDPNSRYYNYTSFRSPIDEWCAENITGDYVIKSNGWLVFEYERDRVLFKTFWL